MSYIGVQPIEKATRTLTQGTLGADSQYITVAGGYTPGNVLLYINGLLWKTTDYDAVNGSSIDLKSVYPAGTDYVVEEVRNFLLPDLRASMSSYDNTASGLTANNVKDAIDELSSSSPDPATTTEAGIVELSTDLEAQSGTDATRSVTPANLNATVLGMGQTWQDLTASRGIGVTYTNSTGRTIIVALTSRANISTSSTYFYFEVSVDGTNFFIVSRESTADKDDDVSHTVVVPNGYSYRWVLDVGSNTAAGNDFIWMELR